MGGIERALSVLANEWAAQDIEVTYISSLKSEPFYKLNPAIKVVQPYHRRSGGLMNKLLYYPRLLHFLRNTVRNTDPDRVLVFGDWFSPMALLALLHTKYPVYISDRTIPDYTFKFPIPQLKKWLYPKAAGFIAQTQRSKQYKEAVFGKRFPMKIIPNALPEFKYDGIEKINRQHKIIYIGRFAWEKDPEILVRAMTAISKNHPDWKLEMAGSGPLLQPMQALVKDLNLQSFIEFRGNVQNVEVLYKEASILVLPSVVEGFPNTLIEAMSFGLPCICFQDIPYEDIVTDGIDGLVIKERKEQYLADAISKLIDDQKLRLLIGENAKNNVQRFNKEVIARSLLDFMKL